MSHSSSTAVLPEQSEPATRNLRQFQALLSAGSSSPYSHAVLLGLRSFELGSLLRDIERGLPYSAIEKLSQNLALPLEQVAAFIDIPRRTLTRRKKTGRLLPTESDRLLRASRIAGRALELFDGNRDAAIEWLLAAQRALGGAVPFELARTELGAREVERLIERLEHGVFS